MARPPEPLPPKEQRLTLREAAEVYEISKKALDGRIERGALRYAKVGPAGGRGRGSERVTTREWIEAMDNPPRLRSTATVRAWEEEAETLPTEPEPLLELIRTLGAENAELRAELARLRAERRGR